MAENPKAPKAPTTSDAAPASDQIAELKAMLAEQNARMVEQSALIEAQGAELVNLAKLHAAERPATLPQKVEQDRQEWYQDFQAKHSRTVKERSQENAEREWGAETKERYRVSVADVPELLIPARSPEEAKGRYDKLCGIRSVDLDRHSYKVEKVQSKLQTNAA